MIKIAGYKLPRVALPRIVYGDEDKEKHHGDHSRSHEHDSVMADVHERMAYPPHTWKEHRGKSGGLMAIVEMEYKELMEDKASGDKYEIEEELIDLAAACICALKKMKSM